MFEIKIRLKHDCPYIKIANMFDFPIYSYCSELYDLILIPLRISDNQVAEIEDLIIFQDTIEIKRSEDNNNATYIYFRCMCLTDSSISPQIQKHGGMLEHPTVYKGGWEYHKIICLNPKTQSSVLKYLQTIAIHEILSIRDLGREGIFKSQFISANEFMNNLTDRQIEVLVKAFEEGYYQIPRTVKTEELAFKFDVSRAAIEKSLRKAENSIMAAIVPYLLFHRKSTKEAEFDARLKLMQPNSKYSL